MDKNTHKLIDNFLDSVEIGFESTEEKNIVEEQLIAIAESAILGRLYQKEDKAKEIKNKFIIYFDGYFCEPEPNRPSTFQMGVCKLVYSKYSNKLTVHLRRPGLLIGKGGKTISALGKFLECEIDIIEVDLLKD